uniref:Plastid lipid-associated protein/fibrillin conserved domain-containing protein n=1 Tax=Ditylum brightwellii TaxID=49249 RepID=A0A7S2ELK7_9STRA|mmetsp:Transcript_34264/g.51151  ORF Transcript_34264/g.51151 Transcript_34264/m.51151 type:complete len:247 (+) Transcript_34264:154-894(+)
MANKLQTILLLLTCASAFSFHVPTTTNKKRSYSPILSSRDRVTTSNIPLNAFFFRSSSETKQDAAAAAAKAKELKDSIRQLSKGTSNGIAAPESTRDEIATLCKELEKMNKVKNIASSTKMDGSWNLVYTTNEGSSAGKLGPFTGEVEQAIRILGREENPEYINYVRLGGGLVEGALGASWDVLSNNKWLVKFETLQFRILGIKVVEKELSAQGVWRMEYLDDDFRILYAAGGVNVPKENVYILSK